MILKVKGSLSTEKVNELQHLGCTCLMKPGHVTLVNVPEWLTIKDVNDLSSNYQIKDVHRVCIQVRAYGSDKIWSTIENLTCTELEEGVFDHEMSNQGECIKYTIRRTYQIPAYLHNYLNSSYGTSVDLDERIDSLMWSIDQQALADAVRKRATTNRNRG